MNLEPANPKKIDDRRRGLSTPKAADLEKRTFRGNRVVSEVKCLSGTALRRTVPSGPAFFA